MRDDKVQYSTYAGGVRLRGCLTVSHWLARATVGLLEKTTITKPAALLLSTTSHCLDPRYKH